MLPLRIWLGPMALVAAAGAAAQNATVNSSTSATSLTPAVVLMGFPSCSISCETYEAGVSMYIENAMCAAYPKQSQVNVIITACIITFALAIPVVAARCFARWKLSSRLWSDDYMSIAATLDYAGQIAYIWVQITSKLAVLLLYYRVFKVASWFRWAVKICMVFKLMHGLVYTFVVLFQCSPVSAFWDTTITDATCLNEGLIIFSGSIVSIVEDVVLMLLPIPELRKLQVSGRKRWGVAIMFAFASFGTIASIIRLRYLLVLDEGYDSTWKDVDVVVWSLIENLMAVVCGSLPSLRPYVDPWIPRVSVTWPKSRGSSKATPKHATDNSTANSDTLYSPSVYHGDYRKYSYPPPPRSPSYGRWKESHPVGEDDPHHSDDVELGLASVMIVSRKSPEAAAPVEQSRSSESETELIIQGNRASGAHIKNQRSGERAAEN
ncbi:hypothetical protein KJ359_009807 [Pestalotiopsis sp. 9143b]|nr:hypothetical protein KJ359_009807 [Pestalotiopsis sp. 9143b]